MPRAVIALLTDFGLQDHYVGVMKGVMLGISPDATFVDISHDVPAQDVMAGALELAAAYRYFPAQTIFLAVVDPGVGSARRAIAAEAGGFRFVGPDNGLFGAVFAESPPTRVVELTDPRYARADVSRTFEGRDRFGPAAAWLATGVPIDALGPAIEDPRPLTMPAVIEDGDRVSGEIVRIDRFGNLVTNIDRRSLAQLDGTPTVVRVGGRELPGIVSTYAETAPGELCALVGSTGCLEIAVNGASAARRLDLGRGAPVHVLRRA